MQVHKRQSLERRNFFSPDMQADSDIEELDDGGVLVNLDPQKDNRETNRSDHQENLVNSLNRGSISIIGSSLKNAIEEDLESRKEWESTLVGGLSQLGLVIENKEFPFSGACGVYSNAFMQAVITFVSNAVAELLPPDGPAKIAIKGEETDKLEKLSERTSTWMNLYLTELAPEYYPEWEQALNWFTIAGNLFKKVFQDPIMDRPVCPYIKPQDLIVNYGASSLQSASRITHVLDLTKKEIRLRQKSGFYADISLTAQNEDVSDPSEISKKLDEISGLTSSIGEYNERYRLYECHVDLDIDIDRMQANVVDREGKDKYIPLPYIVTIEAETGTVLSIYRNWLEDDASFKKINYFVHACYFPGLGFYGLGLAHIAGGNAKASTIIERQLIDAGTLSNFPGGLRAKGMRMETNNVRIGPTEFVEIDTGGMPISQAVMMMPYQQPSEILYNLKKELEENTLSLAGAANQPYGDFNPNAPVGTTLALLEQSHRAQSSVMRRLHRAMGEELKLVFDLFGQHLPEQPYPFAVPGGQHEIMRSDFHPSLSIQPVSDPNISGSTQRLIRAEAVLRFAQQSPELHDMREAYEHVYRELKIPANEIDNLLLPAAPKPEETQPLDPLTENQNVTQNKPVKAALWQDHQAHISVHSLLQDDEQFGQLIAAHIAEHQAYQQQIEIQGKMQQQLPDNLAELPPEVQNQIAAQMAQAANQIMEERKAQEPPPPIDPGMAMMKDIEMKATANDQRAQLEQQKIQLEQMKIQINAQLEEMKLQQKSVNDSAKMQLESMKIQLAEKDKQQQNSLDNYAG